MTRLKCVAEARRLFSVALALATAFAVTASPMNAAAAADATPACAGGATSITLPVAGQSRQYFLCRNGVIGPAPLVVVVHGYTTTPRTIEADTGWSRLGASRKFITVYPLGHGLSWNAWRCCGSAARDKVDDVAFMGALVADVRRRVRVTRSYYAGFSNGAMLGYRLNCGDRGPFSAFVGVAGTGTVPACHPLKQRPMLVINGLVDGLVPYNGCRAIQPHTGCSDKLHVDLPPVPGVLKALRSAAGCTGLREDARSGHARRFSPTGCRAPSAINIKVDNLDHYWPTDASSYGVQATTAAWAFLSAR